MLKKGCKKKEKTVPKSPPWDCEAGSLPHEISPSSTQQPDVTNILGSLQPDDNASASGPMELVLSTAFITQQSHNGHRTHWQAWQDQYLVQEVLKLWQNMKKKGKHTETVPAKHCIPYYSNLSFRLAAGSQLCIGSLRLGPSTFPQPKSGRKLNLAVSEFPSENQSRYSDIVHGVVQVAEEWTEGHVPISRDITISLLSKWKPWCGCVVCTMVWATLWHAQTVYYEEYGIPGYFLWIPSSIYV